MTFCYEIFPKGKPRRWKDLEPKMYKFPMYHAITKRNTIAYEHAMSLSYDMKRILNSIESGVNPYTSISPIHRAIMLDLLPTYRQLWPKLGSSAKRGQVKTKSHQIEHAKVSAQMVSSRLRLILKGYRNIHHV